MLFSAQGKDKIFLLTEIITKTKKKLPTEVNAKAHDAHYCRVKSKHT